MAINFLKKLEALIDNMTPEEKARHEYLLKSSEKPKGWLSIEEHLPVWKAKDFEKGYTTVRVRYSTGRSGYSQCTDHNMWYHIMKDSGVTHWWND